MAKNSTPLQGLIFSKSRVHGYVQILGKVDYLIENLNLIKIWQHVLKGFISSRVIRGSSLVKMSGDKWLLWVQCDPQIKVYYLTPL